MSAYFTIRLHHGGQFRYTTEKVYVGGWVNYIDFCDSDEMSLIELEIMGRELGYLEKPIYMFLVNGFDLEVGLIEIKSDKDAMGLNLFVDELRIVNVYMKPVTNEEVDIEVEEGNISDNSGSSLKGSDPDFNDSFDELTDEDDDMFSANIDHEVEWVGVDMYRKEEKRKRVDKGSDLGKGVQEGGDSVADADADTDYPLSDDLRSICDLSDVEDTTSKNKYLEFNASTDMESPVFKLGMVFNSRHDFKEAVRRYAIKNGKEITFPMNEKNKVRAVCKKGCEWVAYASMVKGEQTMQVKTLIDKHTCNRSFDISHANSKWLSKVYMEQIRSNPSWPLQSFRETVQKDYNVNVSRSQVYRAKRKAMDLVQGTSKEQFAMLWDYMNECKRSNPGSTLVMKVTVSGQGKQSVFRRLYVCWGALKKGFLECCRPLIGLDGCHLKGPFGGILLSAVGVDANNQLYPIAYAIVEKETKSSWMWFIELLKDDLVYNQHAFTIISDKQKGLVPALEEVLPNVEHRFCVRHMYSNFREEHKGIALKNLLWKAARATRICDFNSAMEEINSIKTGAYGWLVARPAVHWSRSHFNTFCKCDMLLNNLCECFNANILDARDKPIITMLEKIRINLMERIHKKRDKMKKCDGLLCPAIQANLEQNKVDSAGWIPRWNGDDKFEVVGPYGAQLRVDIGQKTCGCRKWDLTGIPCQHAISALNYLGEESEKYVSNCYLRETFLKTYDNLLIPINGKDLWENSGHNPVLPPNYTRQAGRPKKGRNKKADEKKTAANYAHKLGKKGVTMRCTLCGSVEHNKRRCPKNTTKKDSGGISSAAAPPMPRQKLTVRAKRGGGTKSIT